MNALSRITLAQRQGAAFIENMFGVTTSDDYRPVAWMGRYPVDVTTMLVGVHVAAAILAAILVAFGAGTALVRNRDVSSVCLRARSGTFSRPTGIHRVLCFFAGHTRSATDRLGTVGTVRNCRFAGAALWNLHCVRHDLSACRIVAADNGEVDRADSCRRLHVSPARLSRLERSHGALDEHWCRIRFRRTEWRRPRARLVEHGESTVHSKAQISYPSETTSA